MLHSAGYISFTLCSFNLNSVSLTTSNLAKHCIDTKHLLWAGPKWNEFNTPKRLVPFSLFTKTRTNQPELEYFTEPVFSTGFGFSGQILALEKQIYQYIIFSFSFQNARFFSKWFLFCQVSLDKSLEYPQRVYLPTFPDPFGHFGGPWQQF